KATRAELHERLARWLDSRPDALDEIVGFHLEQAYRYGSDLGSEDIELAHDAAQRLGDAGVRPRARVDNRVAAGLLRRAVALPLERPMRLALEIELGYALKSAGDLDSAIPLLSACVNDARAQGDAKLELRARIELAWPQLTRSDVA